MKPAAWVVFILAAMLEVGGDAVVRLGLRGGRMAPVLAGWAMLCAYGLLVNCVKWDFSKMLGVYIGFFALGGVLFGRIAFRESIPASTWLGLALIMAGGLVIQSGLRR